MSRTKLQPQEMWVCVFEGKHYHFDTLGYTKKESRDLAVSKVQSTIQKDFTWEDLKAWKAEIVRIKITPELLTNKTK